MLPGRVAWCNRARGMVMVYLEGEALPKCFMELSDPRTAL